MECNNIQHTIIDFIEGNVSEDIKLQIEEHLLNCEECRMHHKQTRALLEGLHEIEDELPGDDLKLDFYNMLENEKENIINTNHKNIKRSEKNSGAYFIRYAAAAIIFLSIGFFTGHGIQLRNYQNTEIAALRRELSNMQQTATMASLSQPTASQRLKAINTINEQLRFDEKTINVLITTFKSDENINVRMAAANALANYPDVEDVRTAFIEALETESDPALQITLISLLTQIQDERAKKAFEKILDNENTIPVVKEQVKEGLKVFI